MPESPEFKIAAEKRLHMRAARLIKLLKMNSPVEIILNEVVLLRDAARTLDPDVYAKIDNRQFMERQKIVMGFCGEIECPLQPSDNEDYCDKHLDELVVDPENLSEN